MDTDKTTTAPAGFGLYWLRPDQLDGLTKKFHGGAVGLFVADVQTDLYSVPVYVGTGPAASEGEDEAVATVTVDAKPGFQCIVQQAPAVSLEIGTKLYTRPAAQASEGEGEAVGEVEVIHHQGDWGRYESYNETRVNWFGEKPSAGTKLYLRPSAQVAAPPKHDEGREALLSELQEILGDARDLGYTVDTSIHLDLLDQVVTALATQPAARQVTDKDVEAVERAVGFSSRGWDMVNPKEIIAAAIKHFAQPVEENLR